MLNDRISPRKAIQEWLRGTQEGSEAEYHTFRSVKRASSPGGRNVRHARPPDCPNQKTREAMAYKPSLAKRLGLHPPFSAFPDTVDAITHVDEQHYVPRKRRRRYPSSDSLLEDHPHQDYDAEAAKEMPQRTHRGIRESADPRIELNTGKMYERRKRHKTREDRYDLKLPKRREPERGQQENMPEPPQPRSRKKRNVRNALIRDYTAANVAQKRLTMKATAGGGIFTKGRASTPIKRKGLVASGFSEVAFLNRHRDKADESARVPREKERQSNRRAAVDVEEEMSRFFSSARPPQTKETESNSPDPRMRTPNFTDQNNGPDQRPPPPIHHQEWDFLGSVSDRASPSHQPPSLCLHYDQGQQRSESRSATYYTWSNSIQSPRDCHEDQQGSIESGGKAKVSAATDQSSDVPYPVVDRCPRVTLHRGQASLHNANRSKSDSRPVSTRRPGQDALPEPFREADLPPQDHEPGGETQGQPPTDQASQSKPHESNNMLSSLVQSTAEEANHCGKGWSQINGPDALDKALNSLWKTCKAVARPTIPDPGSRARHGDFSRDTIRVDEANDCGTTPSNRSGGAWDPGAGVSRYDRRASAYTHEASAFPSFGPQCSVQPPAHLPRVNAYRNHMAPILDHNILTNNAWHGCESLYEQQALSVPPSAPKGRRSEITDLDIFGADLDCLNVGDGIGFAENTPSYYENDTERAFSPQLNGCQLSGQDSVDFVQHLDADVLHSGAEPLIPREDHAGSLGRSDLTGFWKPQRLH